MSSLNTFDVAILVWLNHFAQRWWLLDRIACVFEAEPLLKGGVLTAFLWWAWFRGSPDKRRDRAILVAGVASGLTALAICRIAAWLLPFRQRPFFEASLHFTPPLFTNSSTWVNWSSFPSDHAGLFFSLAASLSFAYRRAGLIACLYTVLFICLPRIYLGEHYATDILAGIFIGALVAWIFTRQAMREALARLPLRVLESAPSCFYVAAYTVCLLLTTNFEIVRKAGSVVFHALRTHGNA